MSTPATEIATYTLDPAHTTVEFVVRHLMITKVRGRFTGVTGSIEVEPGSDVPSTVRARIEAATIDTREPQRDAHLQSADFFEAEKYPTLEFISTRIDGIPGDFTIYGNLTIHGVTRDVALQGEFEGRVADPWGGQRIGYSASTTINRRDFGLTWNAALEAGGVVVGDEVRVELNVEALLQTS
ncbi:MAG: polyisoprenoid-binding protein [Candidatus Eremiobacteraeota bacterium]|nr:polyisoprenoid-binding protein [Candidatus Eremiobacteraeota bacterium]